MPEKIIVSPLRPGERAECTADSDFMVYGALRCGPGSLFGLLVMGPGFSQGYDSSQGLRTETFAIGAPAGETIRVSALGAQCSGYVTLSTASVATASITVV